MSARGSDLGDIEPGTTPPDPRALVSALSTSVAETRERVFDEHIARFHNQNPQGGMKRASSVSFFIVSMCVNFFNIRFNV